MTEQVVASRPMRKDAARNRELLIEAAREVFARRGLEASLDDVARHAGLGVGTAYRHFANKYELASALMEQTIDKIIGSAEQAIRAEDPWQGLVDFLESALVVQAADRGLREVLMGVHDPEKMEQVHDRIAGPLNELMHRAQAAGVGARGCRPHRSGLHHRNALLGGRDGRRGVTRAVAAVSHHVSRRPAAEFGASRGARAH